ncbi:MAG: hypothetical protein F4Z72_02780 [Gemmatimonadales bacterium]|nr:hypothetical protein [Candidatus Palauibacter irciniicola]MYC18346.1 hypothetical protein [Gemmatimonadales bacterium]
MFELDTEVRHWRTRLERGSSLSARELDELEDHLRARVDLELELSPGVPPANAFATAVDALGEPRAMAREFVKAGRYRWRHLLLAGWAVYVISFFLPIFPALGLEPLPSGIVWTAPAYEWFGHAIMDGWLAPLIPNLPMVVTFLTLLKSRQPRVRWLAWAVGTFGAVALGLGVYGFFDGTTLGLGYWVWSAAHVLVAGALLLGQRRWASVRLETSHA